MKITNKNKLLNECCKFIDKGDGKEVGIFLSLLSTRYLLVYDTTKKEFLKSLSKSIDIINEELSKEK